MAVVTNNNFKINVKRVQLI